jgi:formamidopyrimidine-DNA glycosylase
MPELAETFILASQLSQLLGVPLETDSRLVLPMRLTLGKLTYPPYDLVVHDPISLCGDEDLEERFKHAYPTRVQHQGKKMWILWKTQSGVLETEVRLGMTGGFRLEKTPHTRLEFRGGGASIFFNDIRKFGGIVTAANRVAPSATANANFEQLYLTGKGKKWTVKETMTDQNFLLSGVGNYVINEACHKAGVHPRSYFAKITVEDFSKLMDAIREIVVESVQCGGCTLRDFKDIMGRPGNFQERLKIYSKGECPTCGSAVAVVRLENETTSWVCVKCQPYRR